MCLYGNHTHHAHRLENRPPVAFALQFPIDDMRRWPTFAVRLDGEINVEGIIYDDLVNGIAKVDFNVDKRTVPSLQKLDPSSRRSSIDLYRH